MAITISTKKKEAPTAKKVATKATKVDPQHAVLQEFGYDSVDRLFELELQMQAMKPLVEEYEKLRSTFEKTAKKHLDDEKHYFKFAAGQLEVPATPTKTEVADKELLIKRLEEINPNLIDECFTPALGKIKGYLSGPMAEGIFKYTKEGSRKPKVKLT